jgi:hypothetical protein
VRRFIGVPRSPLAFLIRRALPRNAVFWHDPTDQEVWKLLLWLMILGCAALGVVLFFVPVTLNWDQWLIAIKIRLLGVTLWIFAAGIFGLMRTVEWLFDL